MGKVRSSRFSALRRRLGGCPGCDAVQVVQVRWISRVWCCSGSGGVMMDVQDVVLYS